MVKNGTVVYVSQPSGLIIPDETVKYIEQDIDLEKVPLNGGVLIKTLALSSDPYMRYRMRDASIPMFCPAMTPGQIVDNFGVGIVLRSEDPKFQKGDFVDGYMPFQEYFVWPLPAERRHFFSYLQVIKREKAIPATVYTGVLGLVGKTVIGAYDTFAKEKTKEAKTIFVSAAAGAVGSFVCEYARVINPNIKVIGSAGSKAKVEMLKKMGVDVTINYKEDDVAAILEKYGPVDIYWDNVAGPTLDAALVNMSDHGLIIACGAISAANSNGEGSIVKHFEEIFQRSITVKGFIVGTKEVAENTAKCYEVITPLVLQGKITYREHRFHGLKQAGEALLSVHTGTNTGKAVIVVADE